MLGNDSLPRAAALVMLAGILLGPAAGRAADELPEGPIGSPAALERALALIDKSPGTLVAEVNGKPVSMGDVAAEIRNLPRVNAEATFPRIFREAADLVIARKVLADKAADAGLATSPAVRHRIDRAEEQVLGDELLRRSMAPNLLEPAVKATYDATGVAKAPVTEVALRVIAVDTSEQAAELIQKIRGGADFTDLARSNSRDSSAAGGGLLGYQRRDTLAPELAAVGLSMAVGAMTAYPVHGGGLYYVVRCEGRRIRPPLSFTEARKSVEREIVTLGSAELRRLAFKQTNISYYGLMGKSASPAATN